MNGWKTPLAAALPKASAVASARGLLSAEFAEVAAQYGVTVPALTAAVRAARTRQLNRRRK
jgi:hypothetical protein